MSQSRGRGRGRGKNKNLPAWITAANQSSSHAERILSQHNNDSHDDIAVDVAEEDVLVGAGVANNNDNDEEELKRLAAQLNDIEQDKGDIIMERLFVEEEEEEKIAKERREARKRRLQQLASQERELSTNNLGESSEISENKKTKVSQGQQETQEYNVQTKTSISASSPHTSALVEPSQGGNGRDADSLLQSKNPIFEKEKANNGHAVLPVDGQDSFDIFSKSVSPPTPTYKKVIHGNHKGGIQENDKNNMTILTAGAGANAGGGILGAAEKDDAEGYYRATIGEVIRLSSSTTNQKECGSNLLPCFRVSGIIGKGVFSTVLKCTRVMVKDNSVNVGGGEGDASVVDASKDIGIVAMKLIRSNETMAKAAQKEVRILRLLHANHLKNNNHHPTVLARRQQKNIYREKYIVKLLDIRDLQQEQQRESTGVTSSFTSSSSSSHLMFEYHNHTAILFEYMPFNLRETLSKFGKSIGINLNAVRSYTLQLLTALQHLEDHRVVHADIKLDNILVSSDFSTVKLCDFGSAFFETDTDNDPTPYLVSRFYRAPEIILGMDYDKKIDLWSVAVSLAELFTGRVLFPGMNNNDMLWRFMESIGPFSNKMIRRHVISFQHMGLDPHFEASVSGGSHYNFKRQELDKVSGKPVIRIVSASNLITPSKLITPLLLRCRSASDGRAEVMLFGEFLNKCLALDPQKRPNIDELLSHGFLLDSEKKLMVDKTKVRSTNHDKNNTR